MLFFPSELITFHSRTSPIWIDASLTISSGIVVLTEGDLGLALTTLDVMVIATAKLIPAYLLDCYYISIHLLNPINPVGVYLYTLSTYGVDDSYAQSEGFDRSALQQ